MVYAVIDTNVFISALITKNKDAATVKVLEAVFKGAIIPLYNDDILDEYNEVLHRSKFKIDEPTICMLLHAIKTYGVEVYPQPSGEILVDMDDLIFYEVAIDKRGDDAYLITGNRKHYPLKNFIVSPAEMLEILNKDGKGTT